MSPPAAGPAGASTPAEERGRLSIDHTVVRKIAQHTADGVRGTAKAQRTLAGVDIGPQGASARVSGSGDQVDLVIDLALHYPAAVRDVVAQVRSRVRDEIGRITAYRVRSLDVTVSALLPDISVRVE